MTAPFSFAGSVALVTGGGGGIGRELVRQLAACGLVVYAAGRDRERLEAATQPAGGPARPLELDQTATASVADAIERVLAETGRIDYLVNNAGIVRDQLLLRMKDQDWSAVIDTNLGGLFRCCRAALKPMLRQRFGRIVNISSVIGLMGNAGQTNYAAAKAGILGFTKALAREVGSRGITVNAVAPGFIAHTAMTDALGSELRERMLQAIPLERFGTPQDVTGAVLFLLSDQAAYITGQVLSVCGGMSMVR
jgi:3-oxoacyl-[acyl-carrier protein] reductase